MARIPRPDLPGAAFHLTTRLQDGAHRFTPGICHRAVRTLTGQVARSDVRLLAFVMMTNHLHLVVIQGERPLHRFMQPLLTSLALAVQRVHGIEGHVFERRFRDRVCRDPDHLRNAIAYTHMNPVKAGLCEQPGDWPWSSHAFYEADGLRALKHSIVGSRGVVDVAEGLRAFAPDGSHDPRLARVAYNDHLLRLPSAGTETAALECDVPLDSGRSGPNGRPSLDVLAGEVLARHPSLTLEDLRSRWGPRTRLGARTELVFVCGSAGYSGKEIAEYLDISPTAVSRLLRLDPKP